jgi:leader peptidase (prepilin peptidase)/N-methyltransferase
MMALFLLITGFFFGSFLNVLADRLPNDESILGRSHCDRCKHTLSWKDLIPVVSFVYLRGECRYCHAPLSFQYPLLEILTGVLFAVTYFFAVSDSVVMIQNIIFALIMVSCLIVIFFADLRYGLIPDQIIGFGTAIAFIFMFFFNRTLFLNHVVAGLGAFLFFLIIFMLTRGRGIGFGDVKLAFLLGLFLGFPNVVLALYIAFLTGGLIGIILILWKKKRMKSSIAFGPFLVLGTFLSFFFSPILIPKIAALLS